MLWAISIGRGPTLTAESCSAEVWASSMVFKRRNKSSPLKGRPLRQAGQSVQEAINELIDEKLVNYILAPTLFAMVAAWNWYLWYHPRIPNPLYLTVIATGLAVYAAFRLRRVFATLRALKLGRDGERAVGEYLERLRANGCSIFHDINAGDFNIDHVVLSEKGIFVIETKTFSKPNGAAKVHSDGAQLYVDGLGDQSRIIDQVMGNAKWVTEMLKLSTGRDYFTKPVIVFPGWYVQGGLHTDHWVISPKALPRLLESEKQRLQSEAVHMAAYHLSRYIRADA